MPVVTTTNSSHDSNAIRDQNPAWPEQVKRLQWHRFERRIEPERLALVAYCRRLTGNPDDAEDLAHDTLLLGFAWVARLWTDIDHPRAFLFRIARNRWIDLKRRNAATPTDAPVVEGDAVQVLELDEILTLAREALSPTEYDAWLACRVFGATSKEAARTLGRSSNAIKMASSRASRRLQQALERQ